MRERYVHTLRYRYNGWNQRRSRKMFPASYGPFKDEDAAREWIRQSGITIATTLMSLPAAENIKVSHNPLQAEGNDTENANLRYILPQQSSIP